MEKNIVYDLQEIRRLIVKFDLATPYITRSASKGFLVVLPGALLDHLDREARLAADESISPPPFLDARAPLVFHGGGAQHAGRA